jgi:hypothetical protein
MNCSKCDAEMVDGFVGKDAPLHLRFVPSDHSAFVRDYARVMARACPECGCVQLATDPERLRRTLRVDPNAAAERTALLEEKLGAKGGDRPANPT